MLILFENVNFLGRIIDISMIVWHCNVSPVSRLRRARTGLILLGFSLICLAMLVTALASGYHPLATSRYLHKLDLPDKILWKKEEMDLFIDS